MSNLFRPDSKLNLKALLGCYPSKANIKALLGYDPDEMRKMFVS